MAEHAALCVESKDPGNAQALLMRGHILHQFHRFAEAEVLARQVVGRRGLFLDYGLLGDVLLEQGRLQEAAAAYQKMIDLKPLLSLLHARGASALDQGRSVGRDRTDRDGHQGGEPARS